MSKVLMIAHNLDEKILLKWPECRPYLLQDGGKIRTVRTIEAIDTILYVLQCAF